MSPLAGATVELLLARAVDCPLNEGDNRRTFAIATLRRYKACGGSVKDRTNLTPSGRGLTAAELEFIAGPDFEAGG